MRSLKKAATVGLLFCAVGGHVSKRSELSQRLARLKSARGPAQAPLLAGPMPRLPESGGQGALVAWGGNDSAKWAPESILANATSRALNNAWSRPNVIDALVAVPVRMVYSQPIEDKDPRPSVDFARPYGDGQTNAGVLFRACSAADTDPPCRGVANSNPRYQSWSEKTPPLVATLIKFQGAPSKLELRFSAALGESKNATIHYLVEEPAKSGKFAPREAHVSLAVQNGDWLGEWTVDPEKQWGDISGSRVAFVQAGTGPDWFPVDFRHVIVSTRALEQASKGLTASQNRPLLDPERIGVSTPGSSAFARLSERSMKKAFGEGINPDRDPAKDQQPYEPGNIHGRLPTNGRVLSTAVGKGWTWVLDKRPGISPFKNLYTCFERRQPAEEAKLGVPSGGGWHEIGDAAETIINDLEDGPIVVGMATGLPESKTPSGTFAYGLTDVAVIRWLRPGEALVTNAGDTTWSEDIPWRPNHDNNSQRGQGGAGGRLYHWFYFNADREVCTQEWVHNCAPTATNNLGARCP